MSDPPINDIESLDANDGTSRFAVPAAQQLGGKDRPVGWRGRVYGLVVHSTPREIAESAHNKGVHHMVEATERYLKLHGCHYINGWAGIEGGDLVQLANERKEAHGVGVTNAAEPEKDQRRSIKAGRFEADLPPVLVRLWRQRWPDYQNSLDLLPKTQSANSCYVHVECVPCVYRFNGKVEGVEPMRPGLRFTRAQHDAVAVLAVDIAVRNGWPLDEAWWRTPRLVGHEDLTPISRHDSLGGWDPGFLREDPFFDWPYVYEQIEKSQQGNGAGTVETGLDGSSVFDVLTGLGARVAELITSGQEQLAVRLAHQRGVRDVNELTNLVFFARHPELGGRKIQSHETRLAKEWIDVRDTVVRPVLDQLPAESARP